MNVCCIYSQENFVTAKRPLISPAQIPFGISYIASVLKERNYGVGLLVLTPQSDMDHMIRNYVMKNNPSLFCLTAVSTQFAFICSVAKKIKEIHPSAYVVLGGHQATLDPEHTISHPHIDCICIGEGELPIIELASKLRNKECITGIHNLWIKDGTTNRIEKNEPNPFIENLDGLPIIDREMWEPWIEDNDRMHSVLVGRGCPNRCTYCSNHILSKISAGRYIRFRSPDNVISEIEHLLVSNPKIDSIFLEAETLGADLTYTYQLLGKLEGYNRNNRRQIRFGANICLSKRIIDNGEFFMGLKKANFSFINIGLESGSERIRDEILQRPRYSNEDIINVCRSLTKHGIKVNLFALVGILGETLVDFKETIHCIRECSPTDVLLSIFYPYPGTKLYQMAKGMNLFDSEMAEVRLERRRATLDLPGFSRRQIKLQYILFYYHAFKGIWPSAKIAVYVMRTYMSTNYTIERLYRRIVRSRQVRSLQQRISPSSR